MPFELRSIQLQTTFQHLNTKLVRYSHPSCIYKFSGYPIFSFTTCPESKHVQYFFNYFAWYIIVSNFGKWGSRLEVCRWGDFQTSGTQVELKLDNDNSKLCSCKAQILARLVISTIYLRIGISAWSPPNLQASSRTSPQHTQEELGRSSSTTVSPRSTGPNRGLS